MAFNHLIFDAGEQHIQSAIRALTEYNCIQVKKAVDVDFLRTELATIKSIGRRIGSALPPYELLYRLVDTPDRPEFPFYNVLQSEPLRSIISGHFGTDDIVASTHHASSLRCVRSDPIEGYIGGRDEKKAEPFHQDSRCCAPDIYGKMIIVWLLMAPAKSGEGLAPTLKLVPSPVRDLLPVDEHPAHPWSQELEISHRCIQDLSAGSGVWIPEVEIGDAIIFTGMCPHGTYVPPAGTPTRFSSEIKVWPSADLIHDMVFSNPQYHPGHVVIAKDFVVGPTEIKGVKGTGIVEGLAEVSAGRCDFHRLEFEYGRVEDGRDYLVSNRALRATHDNAAQQPIVLIEIPEHPARSFIQLLRPAQTGRTLADGASALDSAPHSDSRIVIKPAIPGLSQTVPDDARCIVCLSDPVDRVLGQFFARPTQPSWFDLERYLDSVTSLDILPSYFARMRRAAHGTEPAELAFDSEQDEFETALRNAEELFSLVCIEERFPESAFLLFETFGWAKISQPKSVPPYFEHPAKSDLPANILAKLESRVRADRQIYDRCVELLEKRLSEADFAPDFAAFARAYDHLSHVLARTRTTLKNRRLRQSELDARNENQKRDQSLARLNTAQGQEIDQLKEKIARMEASYTALLKQHLEMQKVPTQ